MSDGTPSPSKKEALPQTHLQQIRDILLALAALITAFSGPFAIYMNAHNADKIEGVERKVDEKATTVIENQETAADKAKEVKQTLDDSLGPQLYSTWKYLEDKATDSGDAKDKQKAAEAKKAYDDFRARTQKKP